MVVQNLEEFIHKPLPEVNPGTGNRRLRRGPTDSNDLQENLFKNLLDDDVTKAIADLPEEFRTVVILSDIEGLTYEEIADFVDVPLGTVRSRLHRGRRILRARLTEYARSRGYATRE